MRALKTLTVPAVAVLTAGWLSGCSDDSAGPEFGADVEDVAEPPGADDDEALSEEDDPLEENGVLSFVGRTVTVSAEVEEIVTPGVLRIGDEGSVLVFAGDRDFEDLGLQVTEDLVDEDVVVQVTGTVRQFLVESFESEFGVDYVDDDFDQYEGASVIVAERVTTLAGEDMTIAGEVQEVVSPTAFRLQGFGWDVVVIDPGGVSLEDGDYVQVQGTVRRLRIADLQEELGVDLDEDAYEAYEGDLVLLAEAVVPATPLAP